MGKLYTSDGDRLESLGRFGILWILLNWQKGTYRCWLSGDVSIGVPFDRFRVVWRKVGMVPLVSRGRAVGTVCNGHVADVLM